MQQYPNPGMLINWSWYHYSVNNMLSHIDITKKSKMVCKGKIVSSKMIFHGLYQFINQLPRIPQMMYFKFRDIIYAWYYLPSPYTFKYYSTKNNISNCLSTKFSYGISICTDSWYLYAMWDNRSFGSMTIALLGGQHTTWDNRMIYKTMTIALPLGQHTACNNRSIGSMAIASIGAQHTMWDNRSFGSMTIAPPKGSANNVRQNIYWVNGNGNSLARSKRTMCGKNRSIWSMAIVSLGGQHAMGIAGLVGQCLISL